MITPSILNFLMHTKVFLNYFYSEMKVLSWQPAFRFSSTSERCEPILRCTAHSMS